MSLTLALVGDLMFSHRVREALVRDPFAPLRQATSLLRSSDLRIGNLETPISLERRPVPGARQDYYALPVAADSLAAAGFHLVTLANNHVLDFGTEGVERTIQELERVGVMWCGLAGERIGDRVEARLKGPDGTMVAVFAYCGMRNVAVQGRAYRTITPDPDRIRTDVTRARWDGCVVVVVLHEGGGPWPAPEAERTARRAIACGANVVAIHHAHVLGGVERVGDGLIAWGLGNFLAATRNFADERREGMVLRVTLDGPRVIEWEMVPTWINEEACVVPAPSEIEARIRTRVEEMSRIMAAGRGEQMFRASITPEGVARRLREAIREAMRGGGRNLWPTLKSLRPRHARLLWLGFRSLVRRVLRR